MTYLCRRDPRSQNGLLAQVLGIIARPGSDNPLPAVCGRERSRLYEKGLASFKKTLIRTRQAATTVQIITQVAIALGLQSFSTSSSRGRQAYAVPQRRASLSADARSDAAQSSAISLRRRQSRPSWTSGQEAQQSMRSGEGRAPLPALRRHRGCCCYKQPHVQWGFLRRGAGAGQRGAWQQRQGYEKIKSFAYGYILTDLG